MKRLACLAVILSLGMAAVAQAISLQLDGNVFKVVGWKAPPSAPAGGWAPSFASTPAAATFRRWQGCTRSDNGTLMFRARYPIAAGVRYRAVFHAPGGTFIERSFDGPQRRVTPSARVERIYPSADVLPSNQLRLYIYFSAPMSRGEAERRIHVLDANGTPLRGVFLPGQELWDPNNRRLTMTFDPGRIKRDLTSNRAIGAPISEGRRYTVVIDREWPDANGVKLVASFRKAFRGGPAVRRPPDPKTWRVVIPAPGSRDPLVVGFTRSMNYTLLQRMLTVSSSRGNVAGTIDVARQESEWRFTPQDPWRAGPHRLIIDTALEDLAGNKIGQPFDIDVFERVTERITTATTSLPFDIRSR